MIAKPLGFAGRAHQTASTRHGWSKALQLAPDLYPGVGGKRFRASLLQKAYEFAGGEGEAPVEIVDALEMLHAGSLVLDDFEDGSLMRRDQPALHRVIGPARSVNAGNWMYFRALELAGTAYNDASSSVALLRKFVEVARQCHEGQAIDLSTRIDEVTPRQAQATALAISRWKTGRLVSLAAWSGAQAAGADRDTLAAAAAFGCRIGVCLQMKNDLDELIAFSEGAERCDDLRNRRVSWPWAWAAHALPTRRFASMQRFIRRAKFRPEQLRSLACDLVEVSEQVGVSSVEKRIDLAIDRLDRATADATDVQSLAGVANALRSHTTRHSPEAIR
ncbi:MAG: polyprenyl synthetase family protein [Planctomycetota bacterium]